MKQQDTYSDILTNCEENGLAPKYIVNKDTYQEQSSSFFHQSLPIRTEVVKYNSKGEEIFVVSDLHIASGRNEAGIYPGTENFFADDSFLRFLDYADSIKKTNTALLVINGDIFDFLRITDYPGKVKEIPLSKRFKQALKFNFLAKKKQHLPLDTNEEYEEWIHELNKLGIKKTRDELERSISNKEMRYGLQTDPFKTIYKLIKIKNGHPSFLLALSLWMERGNRLLIVKGNHDLELYWLVVRNYIRLIIAEGIYDIKVNKNNINEILKDIVLPGITFIDDSVEIDNDFYIEHGHRYDKFCMVLDDAVLKGNPSQLNLPFGSFFNRYLLNRVELFYPFLDNVRPSVNVLSILLRENFALGLKIMFQYIPAFFKILSKKLRYGWFMFNRIFWFILAVLFPFIIVYLFYPEIIKIIKDQLAAVQNPSDVVAFIINQVKNIGPFIVSYLLARLVAWFQLSEPSSLNEFAKLRFEGSNYKFMTMGHTHNPGEYIFEIDNVYRRFYNTGTWIPVIESSTAEIREDKTYTFLHFVRDDAGNLQPSNDGLLQRWNDDAGRPEFQVLIERK
jgi:UDP-2,3-diacylglucosamine pyrophosphatase LpxH